MVCDIPLVDMSAAQFLSLIRLHAALRELPVLLLGEAKDLESEAELEKLQPVIRLARPYAAVDLEKALRDLAAQTTKKQPVARAEEDSAAFRAALKLMTAPRKESGPEELLRQGFAHLRRNSPFEARKAFQTVISRHPAFTAEALQGLAEVETKRGDSAAGRSVREGRGGGGRPAERRSSLPDAALSSTNLRLSMASASDSTGAPMIMLAPTERPWRASVSRARWLTSGVTPRLP